jgi:hypothetical protein
MDKNTLLLLFEKLYTDAKNNVVWMEKFIEGYTIITKHLHTLYDEQDIPHDHKAMEMFDTILEAAREKIKNTNDLIYLVEHPEISKNE